MNISGLSFNALPPIDLPFRFFITAPLFAIVCAVVVFMGGEPTWLSRWSPTTLALTHGFTLGFLTSVMMGALLQLLPVIGGIGMPYVRVIASFSHVFHTTGSIALLLAFVVGESMYFVSAAILLGLGFVVYLLGLVWVLHRKLSQGDSILGFRFAVAALIAVVALGLSLVSQQLGYSVLGESSGKHITNVHAIFGLGGWMSMLIIAVSYQVLPMFHVAPSFPAPIRASLTSILFLILLLYVIYPEISLPLLLLAHAFYAVSLGYVIAKRKRKVPDTSINYWQFGGACLLLVNIVYWLPESLVTEHKKTLLVGGLFIFGYLVSIVQGMLLKILPFLSYTHLQQRCLLDFSAMQLIPHMHTFLDKQHGQYLFYLHAFSSFALLLAIVFEESFAVFATAILAEFCWLTFLMAKTMRLYFITRNKITLSCDS